LVEYQPSKTLGYYITDPKTALAGQKTGFGEGRRVDESAFAVPSRTDEM
jgi:hypothetical protein